jgi:hypothetical protein
LGKGSPFVLLFVKTAKELAAHGPKVVDGLAGDDPVLWIAYPKKSSKRYTSDLGRDDAWEPIGASDYEPVRQVAIDDDWSALRFRKVENVKTMTRSRALSTTGKKRIGGDEVEAWLAALPEGRQDSIRTIHELVRSTAPELAPSVSGKFLGYGPFHYRYESGREGDTFRVSVANNAQYVSMYVLGEGSKGGYIAEEWAGRLGKASVGKSCVRFKKADDLDLDAVRALVRAAADQQS